MKRFLLTALAATVAIAPIAAPAAAAAPFRGTAAAAPSRGDMYRQGAMTSHNGNGRMAYGDRGYRQNYGYNRQGYGYNYDRGYTRWNTGQRFDRRYAPNYRVIDYRQHAGRGLYAPPRGYQWARSGNDAVLIAVTSGLIGAVLGGALR